MRLNLRLLQLTPVFLLLFVTALTGCDEGPDSDSAVQDSIAGLLIELQHASASNDVDGLEKIINDANRIRPNVQSQKQSKSLLLATAREKLAFLKFQQVSATSPAATTSFALATNQAQQVAMLRSAADSIEEAATALHPSISGTITTQKSNQQSKFDDQLTDSTAQIEELHTRIGTSKEEQSLLQQDAELLFNNAEEAGLIEGHTPFKTGIKTLRKSQQIGLETASIELQHQLKAIPQRDEARAELEAIASILHGMEQSERLLEELQNTTTQSASNYREIASQLDAQTAETMNAALELGTALTEDWSEISSLFQEAMKGFARAGSRESKKATSIWKLEVEWSLGQVEESKRKLLQEEYLAVNALVQYGVVTSSDKWKQVSNSLETEIEQATTNAIAAYENAALLASNLGTDGKTLHDQLQRRMAVLKGESVVPSVTNDSGVPSQMGNTPLDLVEAFNSSTDVSLLDGTAVAPSILPFFEFKTENAKTFITTGNNMIREMSNLLIAIRTTLGEDAIQELLQSNQFSDSFMDPLQADSITRINENSATVQDASGKVIPLTNTAQGWKMVMGSEDSPEADMMETMAIPMFTALTTAMAEATQKVSNGEITSISELNASIEQAMMNVNPF